MSKVIQRLYDKIANIKEDTKSFFPEIYTHTPKSHKICENEMKISLCSIDFQDYDEKRISHEEATKMNFGNACDGALESRCSY